MSYEDDCERNAATISAEIGALKNNYVGMFAKDYRGFWTQVKHINMLFKELRPLGKEAHNNLWQELGRVCEDVKAQQHQEREHRQRISQEKRGMIEEKLHSANSWASEAHDGDDFAKAREFLNEARELMKTGWNTDNFQTQFVKGAVGNDGRMSREDHDACWKACNQTWDKLNGRIKDVQSIKYAILRDHLSGPCNLATNGDPYEALVSIKAVQAEIKEAFINRDQRQFLRDPLNDAFSKAISRIEQSKAEKLRKHQEWRRKQVDFLDSLLGAVGRKRSQIETIRVQISRDQDILSTAKTSDFEYTVQGWIDEKLEKIRQLEIVIDDIESKAREVRGQLDS